MAKNTEKQNNNRTPFLWVALSLGLIGGASAGMGGPLLIVPGAIFGVLWAMLLAWAARRVQPRSPWPRRILFLTTLFAGIVTGAGLMGQSLSAAALNSNPGFFAEMIRGSIGLAESLPFYILNTPLEWILIPLTLLTTWSNPKLRKIILTVLLIWTFHRVWTYLVFAPQVITWSQGKEAFTADQLTQAKTWVNLSWIRSFFDLATATLLLVACSIRPQQNNK
jgi:hypothetical protein